MNKTNSRIGSLSFAYLLGFITSYLFTDIYIKYEKSKKSNKTD